MSNIKILVIEDDRLMLKLLTKVLSDSYLVYSCENGRKALEIIDDSYSLILTDINMPILNGVEVIKYVKDNFPNIPIIILTSITKEQTVLEIFEMGVEDYIKKPFYPKELLIRVDRALIRVDRALDKNNN